MPPIPSGLSTLWLGPATKPSSDIEILKRSLDTHPPPIHAACRGRHESSGSPPPRDLPAAKARDLVVVHHSDPLHESINDRGADESEAALSEIAAECVRFCGAGGDLAQAPSSILDRLAAHETPSVGVEAPKLLPHLEERAGVRHGRFDLETVPHDAGVFHERCPPPRIE